MSYASVNDVAALFRDVDITSTNAAVTIAKITDFLASSTAIINARLNGLYQLPITLEVNPASFAILKQVESFYVASIVDDILNTYSEADKKPTWYKKAMDLLEQVAPKKSSDGKQADPSMLLPDATYLGTQLQKSKVKMSSTDSTVFRKGENNW